MRQPHRGPEPTTPPTREAVLPKRLGKSAVCALKEQRDVGTRIQDQHYSLEQDGTRLHGKCKEGG